MLAATLALLLATTAAAQSVDLSGRWRCNDNATYYVRQLGNEVWWTGLSVDSGRTFTNVFHGSIQGNRIRGRWADVPLGAVLQAGELDIQIVSANRMSTGQSQGRFAGTEWTRETSSNPAPSGGGAPASLNVSGKWQTNFGEVLLTQQGSTVTGTYPWGRFSGTLSGNTYRYQWAQSNGERGSGQWVFAPDGNSFTGSYKRAEDPDTVSRGSWAGTRTGGGTTANVAPPSLNVSGRWQGQYGELNFTQQGSTVSATYSGGRLSGTLSGNTLRFQWDQTNGNRGSGQFVFAADGNSFTGSFNYTGDPETMVRGAWGGTRIGGTAGVLPPAGAPAGLNVSGRWQAQYGEITFSQQGSSVTGSYSGGRISGTLSGNALWFEYDQTNGNRGRGQFVFAPDGNSFTGSYRYTDDPDTVSRGSWGGTRIGGGTAGALPAATSPAGLNVSGRWQGQYGELNFTQQGSTASATYSGGRLWGTLSGNTLRFEYDQTNGNRGRGQFVFAPDGNSFTGNYRYTDDPDTVSRGGWGGSRISR